MASPASGPGKPIVDRFGGNNGRLGDMRPLPVKGKKPKQVKLKSTSGREILMPGIKNDRNDMMFPQPMPYTPIKQTKAVNKVYKTY